MDFFLLINKIYYKKSESYIIYLQLSSWKEELKELKAKRLLGWTFLSKQA